MIAGVFLCIETAFNKSIRNINNLMLKNSKHKLFPKLVVNFRMCECPINYIENRKSNCLK